MHHSSWRDHWLMWSTFVSTPLFTSNTRVAPRAFGLSAFSLPQQWLGPQIVTHIKPPPRPLARVSGANQRSVLRLASSQRPSDVTPTCLHDLFRLTSSWPALSHVINIVRMLITSLQRSVWSLAFRNLLYWLRHAVLQFFYNQLCIYFCFAILIFKPW